MMPHLLEDEDVELIFFPDTVTTGQHFFSQDEATLASEAHCICYKNLIATNADFIDLSTINTTDTVTVLEDTSSTQLQVTGRDSDSQAPSPSDNALDIISVSSCNES